MSEELKPFCISDSPPEIWLEPQCCDGNTEIGRTWASNDAWGECPDCNAPSVKYIRADLAKGEAAPAGEAVAVKPLEWREVDELANLKHWVADCYKISRYYDVFTLTGRQSGTNPYKTLEAAKAAAQTDFEQRIRSALASPAVEADTGLVERLTHQREEAETTAAEYGEEIVRLLDRAESLEQRVADAESDVVRLHKDKCDYIDKFLASERRVMRLTDALRAILACRPLRSGNDNGALNMACSWGDAALKETGADQAAST